CTADGVTFHYGVDVRREPNMLSPFDRIVIATGAAYPRRLGAIAMFLLDRGAGRWPILRQMFSSATVRDWFYHRARRPTGEAMRRLATPGQQVIVIGDARAAGKSQPAIFSAFKAALDH